MSDHTTYTQAELLTEEFRHEDSREFAYESDYQALAARLAALPADWTADSSLETWFPLTAEQLKLTEARLAECEAECLEQALLNGKGSEREARLLARLAEAERLLRATVDGYPIGATNDGGVFVNGGLTGEILVYFALYDEPLRASDSANEVQK